MSFMQANNEVRYIVDGVPFTRAPSIHKDFHSSTGVRVDSSGIFMLAYLLIKELESRFSSFFQGILAATIAEPKIQIPKLVDGRTAYKQSTQLRFDPDVLDFQQSWAACPIENNIQIVLEKQETECTSMNRKNIILTCDKRERKY
uniref:Uncharacterized protein n=1 Tax=Timema shepardi TaxID=629360 RepID=A0A7R9G376_TIMSH|nr:unnamed protein product [Timema shepardi]